MLKPVIERHEETKVVAWATHHGITSIQIDEQGWPDRLFLLPGGRPFFMEFKREGEECSPLQQHRIEYLRKKGYYVEIVTSAKQGIDLLARALTRALARALVRRA